jgi:hypothetical protein
MTNKFDAAADLGVRVRVTYDLHSSANPGEDDTGPYLISGDVGILARGADQATVFPLASLGVLPPNPAQALPTGARDGCGLAGPIAIEKLDGSTFPAVVIGTVIKIKGCLPLAHVLVPKSDTATAYRSVQSYRIWHMPRLKPGYGTWHPPHPDNSLHVARVRVINLPNPPASAPEAVMGWTIAIIEGADASGQLLTIALDRPRASEIPKPLDTIGILSKAIDDELPSVITSNSYR